MRHNLYFNNSRGEVRKLCSGTQKECFDKIHEFLSEHNYKNYYSRYWDSNNKSVGACTIIDVGSWYEFFFIAPPISINEKLHNE